MDTKNMDGAELIAAERDRQIDSEGWSAQHDDDHADDELSQAAVCYATPPDMRGRVMSVWPWDSEWWKPTPDDRIRELVKAGALIAAEIDRLKRYIDLNREEEHLLEEEGGRMNPDELGDLKVEINTLVWARAPEAMPLGKAEELAVKIFDLFLEARNDFPTVEGQLS